MLRVLMATAAAIGLAACGGGGSDGGSTSPPIATPAPTPSPTPTPAPPPTPIAVQQTFRAFGVSAQDGASGGRRISDVIDDATFEVRVNEPDVPEATRFEDINFDGDELILARNAGAIGPYDAPFRASDFRGSADIEFNNVERRFRISRRSVWQSQLDSLDSGILVLQHLEEVRKTASSAAVTGDLPEHARLVDLRLRDRRSIQLFGSRSAVGSIPQTGTAIFAGEVFGNWLNDSGQLSEFVGDAVLSVDFARGTVTGEIAISQYLGQTVATPPIEVRFNATISGETFVAQQVTVTGPQVIQGGTLRGAFFGPVADEIGLILSTSGATGSIMAGLVAGKE